MGTFYNFKRVRLVRIGSGRAAIDRISDGEVAYTDEGGSTAIISLVECARLYRLMKEAGGFPPGDDDDWGVLATVHDFATLELPVQAVVGLRGAIDVPPWFQFLDRARTQFEFRDNEHIQAALLRPLAAAGAWYSWDAS